MHIYKQDGFTLIELSIVLVIIGLIVGGVLVGQDLVQSAAIRAQITQIEKYNTAVNTFIVKFNVLPGDMNAATATQFGFTPRGSAVAQGDSNGMIEGRGTNGTLACGDCESGGETVLFWSDLSYANGMNINLIDGSFSAATISLVSSGVTSTGIDLYLPTAKIGRGNHVLIYNAYNTSFGSVDSNNYFSVQGVSDINTGGLINQTSASDNASLQLTVKEAYYIDQKVDDGLPETGRVLAVVVQNGVYWCGWNSGSPRLAAASAPYNAARSGSPTTCFDNNATANAVMNYSVNQNRGMGMNCALSFRLQ